MNNLERILGDIHIIRRQVAQTTEFRGYGPATLASTGALAIAAAAAQMLWIPDPANHVVAYLALWGMTAVLSAALIGMEMYARTRRIHTGLADEMLRMAVEQFLPAVGVGAVMTLVVARFVPGSVWMLPGLWQLIYALGVFSSCRFLPRLMLAAGVWFTLTGLTSISLADERALSPWMMGIAYGAGQVLIAGILLATGREGDDGA